MQFSFVGCLWGRSFGDRMDGSVSSGLAIKVESLALWKGFLEVKSLRYYRLLVEGDAVFFCWVSLGKVIWR